MSVYSRCGSCLDVSCWKHEMEQIEEQESVLCTTRRGNNDCMNCRHFINFQQRCYWSGIICFYSQSRRATPIRKLGRPLKVSHASDTVDDSNSNLRIPLTLALWFVIASFILHRRFPPLPTPDAAIKDMSPPNALALHVLLPSLRLPSIDVFSTSPSISPHAPSSMQQDVELF